MDHREAGRYWDDNADAWTELARAGYDVYRDHLNTPLSSRPSRTSPDSRASTSAAARATTPGCWPTAELA
jgi:hypothetical protein